MKILVIGLGSMGRRRIRLISKYFKGHILFGTDMNVDRCNAVSKEYSIKVWDSLDRAIEEEQFDCAFVCTSPLSHSKIIRKCLQNDMNIFTEINLVADGYEENLTLAKEKNLLLFLSSTMIYKKEMKFIASKINQEKKYSYTYHVGQYLPDWHPWENYTDFFVGEKKTNGCREILAIELPWIIHVFGKIEKVQCVKSKITDLSIDYDDNYIMLITHENGTIGTICVDVVACEPIRSLKIVGNCFYLSWDGDEHSLFLKKDLKSNIEKIDLYDSVEREEGYNHTIMENEYINELEQFFGELANQRQSIYGFMDDMLTLSVIDEVESE